MNVKQWALFFVVTLSVNYVSATFLPFGGGSHGSGRRRSYAGWNTCNDRLHGFISSHIRVIRRTFQSKYGEYCSLGDRHLDDYTLKNVRARGFGDFTFGDTCQYNIENGQAFIRFAITFEKIIASFFLVTSEDVGGILGEFVETIFGIIGHFVNKLLHIVFPPFLCDIVVIGDYDSGFRLYDFRMQKPDGNIGFLGGLNGHADILSYFSYLIFEPIHYVFSLFLQHHLKPMMASGIRNWDYNEKLSSSFGWDLGFEGRSGGSTFRKESEDEESGEFKLDEGESDEESGLEGRTGGRGYGGRSRHGGKSGRWSYGRRTGGSGYDGRSEHEKRIGESGGGSFPSGGSYRYEYEDKNGDDDNYGDDD